MSVDLQTFNISKKQSTQCL